MKKETIFCSIEFFLTFALGVVASCAAYHFAANSYPIFVCAFTFVCSLGYAQGVVFRITGNTIFVLLCAKARAAATADENIYDRGYADP